MNDDHGISSVSATRVYNRLGDKRMERPASERNGNTLKGFKDFYLLPGRERLLDVFVRSFSAARRCERVCRFESLIVSHHSRFTCECTKEEIKDDDDDARGFYGSGVWYCTCPVSCFSPVHTLPCATHPV